MVKSVPPVSLAMGSPSPPSRGGDHELASAKSAILSSDVSRSPATVRLYPLLDICGLRGCLIAGRDGV